MKNLTIGALVLGSVLVGASMLPVPVALSKEDAAIKQRVIKMQRVEKGATATTTSKVQYKTVLRSDRKVVAVSADIRQKYPHASEVIEKRTHSSRSYDVGEGTTVTEIFAGENAFVKSGDDWFETDVEYLDEAQGERISLSRGLLAHAQTTFYPSMDGYVRNDGIATWASARGATTGTSASDSASGGDDPIAGKYGATFTVRRTFFLFDTSSIPDSDTITAATFSLYTASGSGPNADSTTVELVQTSPASDTALTTADFDALTFTSGGSLALASIGAGAYFDVSLNATGLSWISKTGTTRLGLIIGVDLSNTTPTGGNQLSNVVFSEQAGTSLDPKLVVTSTAAATPSQNIIFFD